jgi:hypothetical protein
MKRCEVNNTNNIDNRETIKVICVTNLLQTSILQADDLGIDEIQLIL